MALRERRIKMPAVDSNGIWQILDIRCMINEVMIEELKKALAERKKLVIIDSRLKPSAVLLPIFKKNGKCHIIFTKRTDHLAHHKGQISFPGAAATEDKSLLETALRESCEEIGLKAIGCRDYWVNWMTLPRYSLFCITPFVGLIPYPYDLNRDLFEVEEIFDVSLEDLMKQRKEETVEIGGDKIKVLTYEVGWSGHIWGATAWILTEFLNYYAT